MPWTYSRPDRLDHLKHRASDLIRYLERSRADARDPVELATVDARLVTARLRFRRLSALCRVAKRNALTV